HFFPHPENNLWTRPCAVHCTRSRRPDPVSPSGPGTWRQSMLTPKRAARRSSLLAWSGAASALALLATTSLADEDWRKLLDRQPPYAGPIVRGGGGAETGDSTRGIFESQGIRL